MGQNSNHLFHGTGIYALAAIVQSNSLIEGIYWGKKDEPHGPRLTRSYDVAKDFIGISMYWGEGGIIVLDRPVLQQDFTVQAYTDTLYCGDPVIGEKEEEEAVLTPEISNLDKYLVCIHCDPQVIELAADPENIRCAQQECGWAFAGDDPELAYAALAALSKSPKLNVWIPEPGYPLLGNYFGEVKPNFERASAR